MLRFAAAGCMAVALVIAVHADAPGGQDRAPAAPSPLRLASPDGIALASPRAAAVRTPSAPGAWGGARTGREATLSDRVVQYTIHATLDPVTHTIAGRQTLTWRNRSDRMVKSIYLHLYLNAFESGGSTFMSETSHSSFRSGEQLADGEWGRIELRSVKQQGKAVPWQFVQPDGGPVTDRSVVRLDLPAAVAPGAHAVLDIEFFDQLPRVIARTGWFGSFHLVGQWFPKIGVLELAGERGATEPRWNVHEFHVNSEFYADFGSFDVSLTVPKGVVVGATGELQGTPLEKDGAVTHRYVQHDVHDFAWMADSRFAAPIESIYRGADGAVRVKVMFPPESEGIAEAVMKATTDALAFHEKTLGAYPYRTVTAVIPPYNADEAGGMEYPTFFTTIAVDPSPEGSANRYQLDFTTIHELGHDYFYGVLASNEFEEPMLDEGLNEFWNLRMMRERRQHLGLSTSWMKKLGLDLDLDPFEYERRRFMQAWPPDPLGANTWDRLCAPSYYSVYSRTAVVFHDLEQRIGRDALERGFKAYHDRWKFRHPSTADLKASLIEATGRVREIEEAFEHHVYGTQRVDDRVERIEAVEDLPLRGAALADPARDEHIEKLRAEWRKTKPSGDTGTSQAHFGPFPWRSTVTLRRIGVAVPQKVLVRFADGSSETQMWEDGARWKRLVFVRAAPIVSAQIDPERDVLLDVDKINDSRTREPDRSASRRWAGAAAALAQSLFALLTWW